MLAGAQRPLGKPMGRRRLQLGRPHLVEVLAGSSRLTLAWLIDPPDRNVVHAAGVERSTMPVGPAILESHSIQACHEVELGWPGIAVDNGKASSLACLGDDDLFRRQDLVSRIMVFDDQAGEPEAKASSPKPETVAPWRVGNPCLNNKPPSGSEVPGRIGEACDLVILTCHGIDGVHE